MIFRRPRAAQPQSPVRIDGASQLRPDFVFLAGQSVDLACARPWTQAGGATFNRKSMRAFDPQATANALTRSGSTTAAQTKFTFLMVINRTTSNSFGGLFKTSVSGGGYAVGYEGGGLTVGLVKPGVASLNGITHAADKPLVLGGAHDTSTGEYYILSRELLTGTELRATQTETSAAGSGDGTITIHHNGSPNNWGDSIFMAIGAYQFFPESWMRRYLRNPWALFQPNVGRIWAPPSAGGGFKAAWARNRSQVIGAGVH
jgi:hypothetical protein